MSWLSELIIGRKFLHKSKLAPEEFIQKLKAKVGTASWTREDNKALPFVGYVKGNKMRMRRQMLVLKAFTPILAGQVEADDLDSSVLQGRLIIHPLILLLLGIWFALFFSIAALFVYYTGLDEAADWIMVFPLLFIFLILLMVLFMAGAELDKLESELPALLD